MKSTFWKALATSTTMAMMLAGCSSGQSNESATTYEKGDTVKVGFNFELSGAVASYGNAENNGAKLAIKQYNENQDSKYTIEIIEQDNKGDVSESTMAASKLIEDQVAFMVGPATSTAAIATYQTASDAKVPVISPSATQVGATTNDRKETYPYAFRICFEDSNQGKAMAAYTYNTLGKKKAAILNEVSDYGQGLAEAFTKKFESMGGEVVSKESYNAGDTDFAGILTKMEQKDFDVLYIAGYYSEAGLIIKQARDDGVTCPIVGGDGLDSTVLVDLAGETYLNDVYFTTAYTTVGASDALTSFISAYQEEYGEDPNMFSVLAYDATTLGLQALEEAGASGKALQSSLEGIEFNGLTGNFTFDDTHSPIKDVLIVKMVDGVQTESIKQDPEEK